MLGIQPVSESRDPNAAVAKGRQPDIPIPAGLLLAGVACVVALVVCLLALVSYQVTYGSVPFDDPVAITLLVLFGALLPMASAYAVIEGWPVGRWLLAAEVLGLFSALLWFVGQQPVGGVGRLLVMSGASIFLLAFLYWLFWSHRVRLFYAALSGSIEIDDDTVAQLVTPTHSRFARGFSAVMPYVEIAGVAVAVGIAIYAFWATTS